LRFDSEVVRSLYRSLVITALIVAVGGHWAVLQSVAWVSMAVSYAQTAPLTDALRKTFDGHHPCKLCKAVREGQKSERNQCALKVETKLDLLLIPRAAFVDPLVRFVLVTGPSSAFLSWSQSPPTPPPRFA
jgi:hypothetical protein